MKSAALSTGVLLLALAAGCGGGDDAGPLPNLDLSPAPLVTPPATALVKGRLIRVGGPAPGSPVLLSGSLEFKGGPDGGIATTEVSASGRYAIGLAPGDYTITGTSPSIGGGRSVCRTVKPVITLTVEAITTADVICSVP